MIFPDDESKKDFAHCSVTLQVVCQYFEFELAKYRSSVEFLRAVKNEAFLSTPGSQLVECLDVCKKVNSLYKRKDLEYTANLVDRKNMIIRIFAGSKEDFLEVL